MYRGKAPSKAKSCREPSLRSMGIQMSEGKLALTHAKNSRPLPLA